MTISVTSRCSLREPEALKAAAQQRPGGGAGRARSGRGFGGAPGEQLPVMAVRMGHLLNPAACFLDAGLDMQLAGIGVPGHLVIARVIELGTVRRPVECGA